MEVGHHLDLFLFIIRDSLTYPQRSILAYEVQARKHGRIHVFKRNIYVKDAYARQQYMKNNWN